MQISSFSGEYRFLSNFWPAQVSLADGRIYPTIEHAYVAAKTIDFAQRDLIMQIPTPGQVKRYGRKLKLRSDWEVIKLSVMRYLIDQKFNELILVKQLLATGNATLIEGNTWGDTYWGVCNGIGENNLGRLLMAKRDELSYA